MGETTGIEWTDHTFNAWWGCAEVSPGCDNCYARTWAARFGVAWGPGQPRRTFGDKHWNDPVRWNRKWDGRGRRGRVFLNSMSDIFDKDAPDGARARAWALIRQTPNLQWILVTKRIGNAPRLLPPDWGDGYDNVIVLISVVNQAEADRDIPKLMALPARWRGLSCEPLLGPVALKPDWIRSDCCARATGKPYRRLDWIIVGGESGHNARPMHPDWARSIRDQCKAAGVPFFFKQMTRKAEIPADLQVRQFPDGGLGGFEENSVA